MTKLEFYGIRGDLLQWIEAFLRNRQQRVVLEGCMSSTSQVLSGVPQGTVLGPTLFLLFINDLPSYVDSPVRLFADDCVIYREIKSNYDSVRLQEDLNNLHRWEQKWLMNFNADKCFVLNMSRKRKPLKNSYHLKDSLLQTVKTTTYLGIEISNDLNWTPHINKITKKANRALGFLRRNIVTSNEKVKSQAYTALVRPHVEYACSVWDPHSKRDINQIEAVQRRAARYVKNRYHNTSSPSEMFKELQWESLEQRRAKLRLINMFKITQGLLQVTSPYLVRSSSTLLSHSLNFQRPYCSTNYLKSSYFPRTIAQWNALSFSQKSTTDLDLFKQSLIGIVPSLPAY